MSKRMLLIGLLVVGVALLSSCEILDAITGGGTISAAYPISGRMKMNLAATVWQHNEFTPPDSSSAGAVATTFWSGTGHYNEEIDLFSAYSWNGGDFSNTWFTATLSEDEKTITEFHAMQTQANAWWAYTQVHKLDGVNVPFSHVDGNSRYYRIEGTAARANVTEVEFKMWTPGVGSDSNPQEYILGGPAALTGGTGDYIEIRLDYPTTAVAP